MASWASLFSEPEAMTKVVPLGSLGVKVWTLPWVAIWVSWEVVTWEAVVVPPAFVPPPASSDPQAGRTRRQAQTMRAIRAGRNLHPVR